MDGMIFPLCDESIFETALKSGIYSDKWNKAKIFPVHKK